MVDHNVEPDAEEHIDSIVNESIRAYSELEIESEAQVLASSTEQMNLLDRREYSAYAATLTIHQEDDFLKNPDARSRISNPRLSSAQVFKIAIDLEIYRLELLRTLKHDFIPSKLTDLLEQTEAHEIQLIYKGDKPSVGTGCDALRNILGMYSDNEISEAFRASSSSNYALVKLAERALQEVQGFKKYDLQQKISEFLGARDVLWLSNLQLGCKIASFYRSIPEAKQYLPELLRASEQGILTGVYCFNPHLGFKIATFLTKRVRESCQREYFKISNRNLRSQRTQGYSSRIKRNQATMFNEFLAESGDPLAAQAKLNLSDFELAKRSDLSEKSVASIKARDRNQFVSLDQEIFPRSGRSLISTVTHNKTKDPVKGLEDDELRLVIESALQQLSPRQSAIVRDRILSDRPKSVIELAQEYGISHQAISQIQKRALYKLRTLIKNIDLYI